MEHGDFVKMQLHDSTKQFSLCAYLLLSITQCLDQSSCQAAVIFLVKERCGFSKVSASSCSSNAMNIFINLLWQVVVDNMLHTWNIKSSGCYGCSNENRSSSLFEVAKCFFALVLQSVTEIRCWSMLAHNDNEPYDGCGLFFFFLIPVSFFLRM